MKVIHNPAVRYFRGQSGGYVYQPAPNQQFSIARSYVYPTITGNNTTMGKIMVNLKSVWDASQADYKSDFATYASRYFTENQSLPNDRIPVNNSFGNFVKAMWALKASDPTHVDLETITVADIVSGDLEVRTVARAVEAQFLPLVETYEDLINDIST